MTTARILVADDSVVSQRILRQVLQNAGYDVMTAVNGREALEFLKANPFDLLFLDIMMPELDGLQVLKRIRSDDHYRELPVVIVTASGDDEIRQRARQAGTTAFLTKPSSSAEVIGLVRSLLSAEP